MAPNCTNQLQRTINVAQNFIRNAPLTFSGTSDPGFTLADWVRQFILGPPFAWRWNRTSATVQLAQGTQDYAVTLPSFGWLESATVATGAATYQLEVKLDLTPEQIQNTPRQIATEFDDGNGNITFRFMPPPEQVYTATLTYQLAPPVFKSLSDTWTPIPDFLSHLYTQGLLAKSFEYIGDPRFGEAMPTFLRQVIAANAGLSDSQLNIFLPERLVTAREGQDVLATSQMGRAARGMYQ